MTSEQESSLSLFVKLCSDRAAFEVRTKRGFSLRMDEVKRTLEASSRHKIVVYTPHVIILRSGSAETTLSRDGRMLIKRVSSEAEAAEVARQVLLTILPGAFKQ